MVEDLARLKELFAYIESFVNVERGGTSTRAFRLDRMRELLEMTGHPEAGRPTIHLAGSKGKGSTAAMVASILEELEFRTGLYLSPHVEDYRERFGVVGSHIPPKNYLSVLERIQALVEERIRPQRREEDLPTTFELLTLAAFLLFEQEGCEWQVIETGLGGRLDATNVVTPAVTIITPIELEHTDYLGDTIPEIAREKAGIIKPGAVVVTGRQRPEALTVLEAKAKEVGAPFLLADPSQLVEEGPAEGEYILRLPAGALSVVPGMPGRPQSENALLAATAVLSQFPFADVEALKRGIEKARLPGRFEMISDQPPVILDGAHTPDSLKLLFQEIRKREPTIKTVVFGPVAGKRYGDMASIVAAFADTVILCSAETRRSVDIPALETAFRLSAEARAGAAPGARTPKIIRAEGVGEALDAARHAAGTDGFVVTGSFYLVGAVRKAGFANGTILD